MMDDMCFQATNGFSLSHDMWEYAKSAFFFEVPLDFESFLRILPSLQRFDSTMSRLKFFHLFQIEVEMLYSPLLPHMFTTPETCQEVLDSCWIPDEPPKDVDGRNLW